MKPPKKSVPSSKPQSTKTTGARSSTKTKKIDLHRSADEPEKMIKFEWSSKLRKYAGSAISADQAAGIAKDQNPPFCKPTLNDPSKKYYCEFSVENNQYICTLVEANDPRCNQ
jgi:hypothetical protein